MAASQFGVDDDYFNFTGFVGLPTAILINTLSLTRPATTLAAGSTLLLRFRSISPSRNEQLQVANCGGGGEENLIKDSKREAKSLSHDTSQRSWVEFLGWRGDPSSIGGVDFPK